MSIGSRYQLSGRRLPPNRDRRNAGLSLAGCVLLLLNVARVCAASNGIATPRAHLDPDGRSFTVSAPGLNDFRAAWSATIERDGKQRVLSSAQGEVATGAVSTLRFPGEGVELLFRLDRREGAPAVFAQAGIRNAGAEPVHLALVTPIAAKFRVSGDPAQWLVTRLNTTYAAGPMVAGLNEIDAPFSVDEHGGFYRGDGIGFLFGPAGEPIAYLNTGFRPGAGGHVAMNMEAQMSGVRVDPGETRWGQQVVLLMEKPRVALARWAEWVAQSHGALAGKGSLSGWCSWYLFGMDVTGKDVLAVVDEVRQSPDRLRPDVIQIDLGYEDPGGRETNEKFPEGLAFYAEHIAAAGARPGLLLDFDRPINPAAWADYARRVRETVQAGFTYLKINLIHPDEQFVSASKETSLETIRAGYGLMRDAAGPDVYILANRQRPDRAALGFVDSARIGHDAVRSDVRAAMTDALRSFHLNGRWFATDNDSYYMGTDIANVSAIAGGWPLVRTWMSMVGLSCGAAITSDPWHWETFKPYWRNVEAITPPARERAEVVDLCASKDWPRLVGQVRHSWGNSTVALLWNPGAREQTVTLDFAEAGLDPRRRYAVWSFWDDQYLGVARGSWSAKKLGPSASQHLCFTDLDRTPNRPVLIGSNLHIWCGAADVHNVRSERAALTIELTDAGAREGSLYVYSRHLPVLKRAVGCAVDGVTSAGENVWRISLRERQQGVPQRIALAIILPVTQQVWFWCLMALVVSSVLFGAWRYVVGVRLQREHALDRERARIVRDLHDDLGANLARIVVLAELAEDFIQDPGRARSQLDKISSTAHELTRQLRSVVWAVDPANDSLESFARYLHGHAEEFLSIAGIRCHFTSTEAMPDIGLSSIVRHHLLMITREALHNVVTHAAATVVTLRIGVTAGHIVIEIADNGRGLPPASAIKTGNGLTNMQARAAAAGGCCEILAPESGPGTRVRVRVPLT